MLGFLMRFFGKRVAHKAVAKYSAGSPFDVRFGFALLRDRRMPLRYKFVALALGAALVIALMALELPIEAILSALVIGLPFDAFVDGLEAVVGPALLGCLLLPHLAPKELVEAIRAEHTGLGAGPVIDIT